MKRSNAKVYHKDDDIDVDLPPGAWSADPV